LGPLSTAATNRPVVPTPHDYHDGEIGGMIGRGNRSTRRKPGPVPLCPPQTPHAARMRTLAAAVASQLAFGLLMVTKEASIVCNYTAYETVYTM
jgi:hypothetical protein